MKNILKIFFAVLVVSGMATSCFPDDNFTMKGDRLNDSMLSFTQTAGSDAYTFTLNANLTGTFNGMWSVIVATGDGRIVSGDPNQPVTFTHEYMGFAGESFTATATFRAMNGSFTRTLEFTLPSDNVRDDPASLQYLLTGGKDNVAGKTWQLGPWTSMRNPANRSEIWWNFFTAEGGQIQGDRFVFVPNSIRPSGGFTHILPANGGSFMNEALGPYFADAVVDAEGDFTSWVTQLYTPPTDATWSIDGNVLVINRGFLGYAIAPSDLVQTRYRVLEFSPNRIRLVNVSTWDGWAFELVPTAP